MQYTFMAGEGGARGQRSRTPDGGRGCGGRRKAPIGVKGHATSVVRTRAFLPFLIHPGVFSLIHVSTCLTICLYSP